MSPKEYTKIADCFTLNAPERTIILALRDLIQEDPSQDHLLDKLVARTGCQRDAVVWTLKWVQQWECGVV